LDRRLIQKTVKHPPKLRPWAASPGRRRAPWSGWRSGR
jgi:hypothetical protein